MLKKKCFAINTYDQFKELIELGIDFDKKLIIYIDNYLIKGFGVIWLSTLIKLIKKNHSKLKVKFYIDAGDDPGLSILIMREKIDYIKLKSNKVILDKINQIAKKNKVLLNPNFDVVEISNLTKYKR